MKQELRPEFLNEVEKLDLALKSAETNTRYLVYFIRAIMVVLIVSLYPFCMIGWAGESAGLYFGAVMFGLGLCALGETWAWGRFRPIRDQLNDTFHSQYREDYDQWVEMVFDMGYRSVDWPSSDIIKFDKYDTDLIGVKTEWTSRYKKVK